MEIRSRYSKIDRVQLSFDPDDPFNSRYGVDCASLTQQQFKEECDIRHILKRFRDLGMPLPEPPSAFEDVSSVADFQTHMNAVARTKEYFDSLPSKVRARFNNDPMQLVSFLNDSKNLQEAVSLGLVSADKLQPSKSEPTPIEPVKEVSEG